MRDRPLSVTVVGWLFVLTGCVGIGAAALRLAEPATGDAALPAARHLDDFAWAAGSGLLAAAGGAFALRGRPWARWALALWMGGHVVIGYLHTTEKMLVHCLIFAPLLFLLFRPRAAVFFRGAAGGSAPGAPSGDSGGA